MEFLAQPFDLVYANNNTALIPELWAFESLRILEESMVMAGLVHRDFNTEVARFGETVHTRKPAELQAFRKEDGQAVTTQDVSSTDVEVKLNQWIHVSFILNDGELTKAFKDLATFYMEPAMQANARMLDRCLAGQAVQYLNNTAGGLGLLSNSTAKDYLLDLKSVMDRNKAYPDGRNLILTSPSETEILKTDIFHQADKLADGGRAIRDAYLGRKFGFNTFMDLNTPGVTGATKPASTTTTAAAAAGAATVSSTAAIAQGTYFTAVGDARPLRVQSSSGAGPYTLTLTRPLTKAVGSGAVLQAYTTGLVDFASGYASGYSGLIHVDGSGVPNVGQLVAFNNTGGGAIRTPEYVITYVTAVGGDYEIMLDRPLETALVDNDVVCYGPDGQYNFAFHRNALTLVNRPLAAPIRGTGALSFTAIHNNLSMRATITYDGVNQGHRVTLDSLFGVKVLDEKLGAVLLG